MVTWVIAVTFSEVQTSSYFLLSSPLWNRHFGKMHYTSAIDKLCMAFSALLIFFLLQEEVETSVSGQFV